MDNVRIFFDLLARVSGDRDINRLGNEIDDVGDGATKASRKFKTLSEGTRSLGQQMQDTHAHVARLREEFDKTGDTGLLKDISKGERDIKRLSGWMKHLGDDSDHSSKKFSLFRNTVDGVGTAVSGVTSLAGGIKNPYVLAGVAATAALASIPIAAAAGGAALLGLGAGFIGLGAVGVRNSEQVKAALQGLGHVADETLTNAAGVLNGPFTAALEDVSGTVRSLGPGMAAGFADVAPSITKLSDGVDGFAQNAMPGLNKAIEAAGPVLNMLGDKLPELGEAFGDLFGKIGAEGQGGMKALAATIDVLNIAIDQLGSGIAGAEAAFDWLSNIPGFDQAMGAVDALAGVDRGARSASESTKAWHEEMDKAAASARNAAFWTRSFAEAQGLLNADTMGLEQAQINAGNAMQSFKDALKGSTASLSLQTSSSRQARAALQAQLQAAGALADKTFDLTHDGNAATAAFNAQVGALRRTTAAGSFARAQMDELIGRFVAARGPAYTGAAAISSMNKQIAMLHDKQVTARAQANPGEVARLQREIDALHGKTLTITVNRQYAGVLSGKMDYFGNPLKKAAGGTVPGSGSGDRVPALLEPDEFVVRKSQARKHMGLLEAINSGQVRGYGSGGRVAAIQELAAASRAGKTIFEDMSYRGMSSNLARYNDSISWADVQRGGGRAGGGRGAAGHAAAFPRMSTLPTTGKQVWSAADKLAKLVEGAFTGSRRGSLLQLITRDSKALASLANQRAGVVKRLGTAQKNLADLTKSSLDRKADTVSKVMGTFSLTGGPEGENATGIMSRLGGAVSGARMFSDRINVLRKRGLAGGLLKQLADAGPDGGNAAALALIHAGGGEFQQINSLYGQLGSSANTAGLSVSEALYGAGIRAAQGLVKGLSSQQKAIESQMIAIATAMQTAIKRALGIHSPSQVMAGLGAQVPAGFAKGIASGHGQVASAAERMAMAAARGAGGSAAGGAGTVINLNVSVAPGTNARQLGAELVEYLYAHQKGGGAVPWVAKTA